MNLSQFAELYTSLHMQFSCQAYLWEREERPGLLFLLLDMKVLQPLLFEFSMSPKNEEQSLALQINCGLIYSYFYRESAFTPKQIEQVEFDTFYPGNLKLNQYLVKESDKQCIEEAINCQQASIQSRVLFQFVFKRMRTYPFQELPEETLAQLMATQQSFIHCFEHQISFKLALK